jgi:hypothetical protein
MTVNLAQVSVQESGSLIWGNDLDAGKFQAVRQSIVAHISFFGSARIRKSRIAATSIVKYSNWALGEQGSLGPERGQQCGTSR